MSKKPKKKLSKADRVKKIEAENKALEKFNDMSDLRKRVRKEGPLAKFIPSFPANPTPEQLAFMDSVVAIAEEMAAKRDMSNLVSTQCPKCNLNLVIPEVESYRCVLCGCTDLRKQTWTNV